MTKLAAAIVTSLLALSMGCGDNSKTDLGQRDTLIDIIPHDGEAITAIESAESLGFTDAIYVVELDIISMVGDPGLVDQLETMAGIDSVRIAEPLMPEFGVALDLEFDAPIDNGGTTPTTPTKPGKGKGPKK